MLTPAHSALIMDMDGGQHTSLCALQYCNYLGGEFAIAGGTFAGGGPPVGGGGNPPAGGGPPGGGGSPAAGGFPAAVPDERSGAQQ